MDDHIPTISCPPSFYFVDKNISIEYIRINEIIRETLLAFSEECHADVLDFRKRVKDLVTLSL